MTNKLYIIVLFLALTTGCAGSQYHVVEVDKTKVVWQCTETGAFARDIPLHEAIKIHQQTPLTGNEIIVLEYHQTPYPQDYADLRIHLDARPITPARTKLGLNCKCP